MTQSERSSISMATFWTTIYSTLEVIQFTKEKLIKFEINWIVKSIY